MRVGERVRGRFIGSNNNFVHPMHIHGGPFTVVQLNGNIVPEVARQELDTVNVGRRQRYDDIWEARRPCKWLLHCHIPPTPPTTTLGCKVAAGSPSSSTSATDHRTTDEWRYRR